MTSQLLDLGQTVYVGKPPYHREVWATEQHNADGWNMWIVVKYLPDRDLLFDIGVQWWWGTWERDPMENCSRRPGHCE